MKIKSFMCVGVIFCAAVWTEFFINPSFKTLFTPPNISPEREAMIKQYSMVPREEMEKDPALMTELKERYKQYMISMNKKVSATGAKFVVMYMTPEVGDNMTSVQRMGKSFLMNTCKEIGANFIDVTKTIAAPTAPKGITNWPKDGHFSKIGAKMIADELEKIVPHYVAHKATTTYSKRPDQFGDQTPNLNTTLDGGKNLPYKFRVNKQGLRQNRDVVFPKTKSRILFMGDSGFFFPFVDNNDMAHEILQSKFPNVDFANACNWAYAIDDYITLWDERAKFVEPDVVIMQTSGSDIMDMYFTNRNRFTRNQYAHQPSALEKAYYERTYKK